MHRAEELSEEARRRAHRAVHSDRDREHIRELFYIQVSLIGASYILRHEASDDSYEESDDSDEQRIIPDIAQRAGLA